MCITIMRRGRQNYPLHRGSRSEDGQVHIMKGTLMSGLARQINKIYRRVGRPFFRSALALAPKVAPWDVIDGVRLTPRAFGEGSIHPFEYYFEGELKCGGGDLAGIEAWLRECTIESDIEQFGIADVWQRPVDFERRRRGDCDDHSLWAWRSLIELGHDARFVCGLLGRNQFRGGHAWVVIRDRSGDEVVVEPMAKGDRPMFMPRASAEEFYQPFCSVDANFNYTCYGGLLLNLQETSRRK